MSCRTVRRYRVAVRRLWSWLDTPTPWQFRVGVLAAAFALCGVLMLLGHDALAPFAAAGVVIAAHVVFIVRYERRRAAAEPRQQHAEV